MARFDYTVDASKLPSRGLLIFAQTLKMCIVCHCRDGRQRFSYWSYLAALPELRALFTLVVDSKCNLYIYRMATLERRMMRESFQIPPNTIITLLDVNLLCNLCAVSSFFDHNPLLKLVSYFIHFVLRIINLFKTGLISFHRFVSAAIRRCKFGPLTFPLLIQNDLSSGTFKIRCSMAWLD